MSETPAQIGFRGSTEIDKLTAALSKAQALLRPAKKDSENLFLKTTYAGLSSLWESAREPLAANELCVMQFPQRSDEGVAIETVLAHSSGQWVSSVVHMPVLKNDCQGVGSAITYGRRYGLAAVVGLYPDEDDDGNQAVASITAAAEQAWKALATEAEKGTGALQALWLKMPNELRKLCAADLPKLKERAKEVDSARG